MRERGREVRGVSGASRRKQEVARGKQEVAEASRARATPRLCSSSWQRRKRTRGRRWAGPAGGGAGPATGKWPRYGSFSLSFIILFCFIFSIFCNLILIDLKYQII